MIRLKCNVEGGRLITIASLNRLVRDGNFVDIKEDELYNSEIQYLITKGFLVKESHEGGDVNSNLQKEVSLTPTTTRLFCTLDRVRRLTLDSIKATVNGQGFIEIPVSALGHNDIDYALQQGFLTTVGEDGEADNGEPDEVEVTASDSDIVEDDLNEVSIDEISKTIAKKPKVKFRSDSETEESFKSIGSEVYESNFENDEKIEKVEEKVEEKAPVKPKAKTAKKKTQRKPAAKKKPARKRTAKKTTTPEKTAVSQKNELESMAKNIYADNKDEEPKTSTASSRKKAPAKSKAKKIVKVSE
jgi:hypothetical protein